MNVIGTIASAQPSCASLARLRELSSTPPSANLPVSRRARAQAGAARLLLTAAALCGLSSLSTACSQPRTEGPKTAEDAVKSDTPPAAAANSPSTAEPTPPPTAAVTAATPPTPAEPAGMLAVGATAPDVEGKDAKGQVQRLSDRRGKVSIVYFYPKDGTPGCTKEACAFRDTFDRFNQRGVTIFGVSRDDEASHVKFRAEHSLPFPLVADPSGTIQKAYGVPDKMPGLASRVTFLVAADGRIAKVWPDVDPAVHADEVFQAIEQLAR